MSNNTFKIIISFCFIFISASYLWKNYGLPSYSYHRYKSEFMELTLKCAHAMDSNWYIEQLESEDIQKSSEIQLLDCHDYDKLRKIMLSQGVNEYKLSYLGLIALEIHQKPAREMSLHHKFRER